MAWTLLSLVVFLAWVWKGGGILAGGLLCVPRLEDYDPAAAKKPRISVIFAFRDEPKVETALRSMLAQDYPDFEIVAVNDRSGPEWTERLRALGSPRLRVVEVRDLPPGWLGKAHALKRGTEASSGEWLLFTDADVMFKPDALARAAALAEKEKLDHLVLYPRLVLKGLWEGLFVTAFAISFWMMYRPWMARYRWSRAFAGVGAFNMVRREAYEKIGTHAAFPLEVADDMMLGKAVKEAGFRQMAASGEREVEVRWAEGFSGVVSSINKNGFTGLHYSVPLLAAALPAHLVFNLAPAAALGFAHGAARAFGAGAVGVILLIHIAMACRSGPMYLVYFIFYPLGALLFAGVAVNSAYSTLKRGGVLWRGTFYPLDELKRHHRL